MEQSYFRTESSRKCPFRLDAIQYRPKTPCGGGYTLIVFHAMNLHKETYTVMLRNLLEDAQELRIHDVWCFGHPNSGRTSALNKELLSQPPYRDRWVAAYYAQTVHYFLSTPSHGIDFASRRLVGVAHSAGAYSLMLMQDITLAIPFEAFILLDPALMPPNSRSATVLPKLFGNWAKNKRANWPSRSEAYRDLSTKGAFSRWPAESLKSFVDNALTPVGDDGTVTLACSRMQEAAFYLAKAPSEIFTRMAQEDQIPIHLVTCPNDEYKGKSREFKEWQASIVKHTRRGSIQSLEKGGHMFPQVEPILPADAMKIALKRIRSSVGPPL